MANTYLQRTFSTGNRKKWTWSAWVKRSKLGANIVLFSSWADSNNNSVIQFLDDDAFRYKDKAAGGTQANLYTNRKFRDTSSWYHIVVVYDSNNSTSGNRIRFYINGVEETSFSTDTMPGQNNDSTVNRNCSHYIGTDDTTGYFFDGSMTHVHFCDGYAYSASDFGETDTTTGEWKAKTSPSVTYGTNGFFILKDGNGITDQSGEGNDFTLGGGTLTNLKDNPDNVFATINPLDNYYPNSTMTHGNTRITTATSNRSYNTGTLGASSGKYYWEVKAVSNVGASSGCYIGIASTNPTNDGVSSAQTLGYKQYDYSYISANGDYYTNSTSTSYGNSYTDNDIIGVALDLDNNKLYFSKNGTWQNSGDPTSGSTGTGAISIQDPSGTVNGVYTPGLGDWWVQGFTVSFNFGNGYFGGTAVSSAGTNASGIGIFEYDVPTGYTALSTKGLNE